MSKLIGFVLLLTLTTISLEVEADESQVKNEGSEKSTIIVTPKRSEKSLDDRTYEDVLNELEISTKSTTNSEDRAQMVHDTLRELTRLSQESLMEFLEKMQATTFPEIRIDQLWIVDRIIIREASEAFIELLTSRPDVGKVERDQMFSINDPAGAKMSRNENTTAQWGVEAISADRVWNWNGTYNSTSNGTRGNGSVVGVIDTGVRVTHEALRGNYRQEFGWFDPSKRSQSPNDDQGHGTHVTGTICGQTNGIGVAPGAQWIACKGCSSTGCSQADLLQCGQFMACPTDPFGAARDCEKRPKVVNNSWGGRGGSIDYESVLRVWHQVGIVPIFAAGNAGPVCHTHGSPGDSMQVISVGSTDQGDKLSQFSSRGPAILGLIIRIKPEVVAPGGVIVSASNTADDMYQTMSGTSMASPHVTGVVALMLAQTPGMSYDMVKQRLTSTCDPIDTNTLLPVPFALKNCGGVPEETYPNNHAGAGKVNALKAVQAQ